MIPILSSILIANAPADASIVEQPINDPHQSSLILAEQKIANHLAHSSTKGNVSIPIAIESPPQTSAQYLGKKLSVDKNFFQPQSSVTWKKPDRILITKTRQGETHRLKFVVDSPGFEIVQGESEPSEIPPIEENNQEIIPTPLNVVEVLADEQEYFDQEKIIKAKGNVVIRFSNGILIADQVLINLEDRVAVAQDNVNLSRGEQVLRGDRFEYYFVEDKGVIFNAQGEVYQPSISEDFSADNNKTPVQQQPLSWQFEVNQPLRRVVSAEGYSFTVGSIRDLRLLQQSRGRGNEPVDTQQSGGQINRLRFQAEKVNFDSQGWQAINIRITNDPFSPPEFEVRADTATLESISPFQDELVTTNSRLVFDQYFSVPLFRNRLIFDSRESNPGLFTIGFDGEDLGGLYIEREFDLYRRENIFFSLTPRLLIQRALSPDAFFDENAQDSDDNGGFFNSSSYGLVTEFIYNISERTDFSAIANLTGLDLDNIDNRLRSTVKLDQKIGALARPHTLSLQYNYRDRLFNGSLGFRTVQQSFGGVITSPYIQIGNSSIGLRYQGSIQNIRAETDQTDLLGANRDDNLVNLTRLQTAAIVSSTFLLWGGEPLPAKAEEGLKYTSTPVAPYLNLIMGLTGVASYYSNGDTQPSLTATIGLQGQLGNFSRPFFDYTGFNISFSQGVRGDQSPFLFDRFADSQVLTLGIIQQLYGPLRGGLQTFLNVETNEEISTDYFLEYSRRTYNIIVRYNPVLEIGSINLRISDFNWEGNSAPFEGGTGIKPVVDGVKIEN